MAVHEIGKSMNLFNQYTEGDVFLASPGKTLLGEGTLAVLNEEEQKGMKVEEKVYRLIEIAKEKGSTNPVVAGAIPFDISKPAKLMVPLHSYFDETKQPKIEEEAGIMTNHFSIVPVPGEAVFEKGVSTCVEYIKAGILKKAVLGRTLLVHQDEPVRIQPLLGRLLDANPSGYTFAIPIQNEGEPQKTLIGASPELLVSKKGTTLHANPLAGSRPRSNDPAEDRRRAEELLVSEKDLYEHSVVVQAVEAALEPLSRSLHVPDNPSVIATETMWHLSTEITGEILNADVHSIDLAAALHPTPAVCGTPVNQAFRFIKEIEPFDRGFFTGMIGWSDENGDGEWAVTIRCAEAEGNTLRLFAGAGIVGDSQPEEERKETGAKFQTMLQALGLGSSEEREEKTC
ncbi:isochorismate synthase DhbC [Bacillus massiliglaciei]|uniref:isochorismate synthase DhbC n=1 Tax=Bacillus massiliglaciei TaxID=1816693 RepID=UPI000AAA392C|nr:isochorismate synthase DhbC [Bacillus massiliglaciei]